MYVPIMYMPSATSPATGVNMYFMTSPNQALRKGSLVREGFHQTKQTHQVNCSVFLKLYMADSANVQPLNFWGLHI